MDDELGYAVYTRYDQTSDNQAAPINHATMRSRMQKVVHNLQGDVIAIVDNAGNIVVEYKYDAWGRLLSKTGSLVGTLGTLNPFRYRGYVYDEETGLCYLNARFYRPSWCRFVNMDAISQLGANADVLDYNAFCYCGNEPILRQDSNGECWHIAIGAVIGAVFELGAQLISNKGDFSKVDYRKVGIAAVVGGVTAACGPHAGAFISGAGNAAIEMIGGTTDPTKIVTAAFVGVGASYLGYGAGRIFSKVGGKHALKVLSNKPRSQIKRVVTKTISIAGKDRNAIKNLGWAVSQEDYTELGEALLGKAYLKQLTQL